MRDPASLGPLLERVLAMPNSAQRQTLVQMAVNSLASSDPDKAVEWLVANPGQSPKAVAQVASQFARTDPARAASYSSRLTGDSRVRGCAASRTPTRRSIRAARLSGSSSYADARSTTRWRSRSPIGDARGSRGHTRLIESIGREDYRRMGIQSLAMRWTNTDPAAAANWATNLRDPAQRTVAVQAVGSTWANRTRPRRRSGFCRSRPVRARRRDCVNHVGHRAFRSPDISLLADISTDQGRVSAVQSAAMMMAQRDADGARAFVESNVTDSPDRERVLSMVSQVARRRFGAPAPFVGSMYSPAGTADNVVGQG